MSPAGSRLPGQCREASTPKLKLPQLDWRIAVAAIITVGALEAYSLSLGHDGWLFSFALISISGIAGFKLRR